MTPKISGHYEQIHFKLKDLVLFYNFPVITDEVRRYMLCHHIHNLRCSKAHKLSPYQCINLRKCELYLNKEKLFTSLGINGAELKKLDHQLRKNK